MSIQLGNKAVEHLINSTPVLGRKGGGGGGEEEKEEEEEKRRKKEEEAVNGYLIKNSKGEGGLSQAVGRTGRNSMGV